MTITGNVTANPAGQPPVERTRIPMSVPTRKLEVPPMPGFHLYWFLEANVPRAVQGGYEFVQSSEVALNQFGVANDKALSGNADLGGQVKIVGGVSEGGHPEHLVLMKIRQEWYEEDQKTLEKRNADVLSAIFRNEQILGSENLSTADRGASYVKKALLQRPVRK